MSNLVPPPLPKRRLHIGYWIAGVASVAAAALVVFGVTKLAAPAKVAYSFVSGNPTLPGCTTTFAGEATVGPLWYRAVKLGCAKQSVNLIYVKRGTGPGWLAFPAVMSVGDPAPLSVRQTGADTYEVVLSKPLSDGRTALPISFDRNGIPKEMLSFDHGRQKVSVTLSRG